MGRLSSAVFKAFVVLYGALWLKCKKHNGTFQQKWHPNVDCTLTCTKKSVLHFLFSFLLTSLSDDNIKLCLGSKTSIFKNM